MVEDKKKAFFATLPGILTGLAAVIGAVTALYIALKDDPLPPPVSEKAQPVSKTFGPFTVVGGNVDTGIHVPDGATIRITAAGTVDFGGAVVGVGAPKLGPEGDAAATPSDYPDPSKRKNSLLVKIGSVWYQGGRDETVTPATGGRLILRTNDRQIDDNSGGWSVHLEVRR
jgi:hypothetical protein